MKLRETNLNKFAKVNLGEWNIVKIGKLLKIEKDSCKNVQQNFNDIINACVNIGLPVKVG